MRKFEQQVKKGMAELDSKMPGWEEEIYLDQLNLKNSCHCVLGQVCGFYHDAVSELGYFSFDEEGWVSKELIDMGFCLQRGECDDDPKQIPDWKELTNEWKLQITERRNKEQTNAIEQSQEILVG